MNLDPADFCRVGTRRVRTFGAAANAPFVAGAGWDGRVHIWNVTTKEALYQFDTTPDNGGLRVALSPSGDKCFAGSYYAWGCACLDIPTGARIWRRRDLKRFYGLAPSGTGKTLIGWFNGRAGLELDAATGETVRRLVGLGGFYSSPHTDWALLCRRSFELHRSEELVYRLPRQSFAELSAAFAPDQCVISESGAATRSVSLTSGAEVWRYDPRAGCHVIALDYCQEIDWIVAVEYAYTEEARAVSSVVTLLHLTRRGEIALRKPIRPWAEAVVFCAQGTRLLNGLGELYDARTGEIEYVFEFPR